MNGLKTKAIAFIQGIAGLLVFFGVDPIGLEAQVENLFGGLLMILAVKDYLLRLVTDGPAKKLLGMF